MSGKKTILAPHIASRPRLKGGRPHVDEKGVTVEQVAVCHELLGMSPTDIAREYVLTLAEVHHALAYYYDHKAEIDTSIREGERLHEELRRSAPSSLADRLRQRGA